MSDTEDSFPEKLSKKLPTGWTDEIQSADTKELKKIMVDCMGNIHTIEKEKDSHEKLNAAKALIKEYMQPFNEAKGVQSAKIKYCLWLLESRGVNLDSTESDK